MSERATRDAYGVMGGLPRFSSLEQSIETGAVQRGADLVYRCGKGHAEPLQSDQYGGELALTPLELINRPQRVK